MVAVVKRGAVSAIDASNPGAIVLYSDGFNNPGFSGGTIVYSDFDRHARRTLGVGKGYWGKDAKAIINVQHVDTNLLVNSGILVACRITYAIKAIAENEQAGTPPLPNQ